MAGRLSDILSQAAGPPADDAAQAQATAPASFSETLSNAATGPATTPPPAPGTLPPNPMVPETHPRYGVTIPAHPGFNLNDTLEELVNAATLGTGKYAEAAVPALFSAKNSQDFGTQYNENLSDIRGRIDRFGREQPGAATVFDYGLPVAESAGLGLFSGAVRAGAEAPTFIGRVGQAAWQLAKNSLKAGTMGGVAAAANTESNDPWDYATNAMLGFGTGAALPPIFAGLGLGAKLVSGIFQNARTSMGAGLQNWVKDEVTGALQKDGMNPQQAMQAFQGWIDGGAKMQGLLDLGGDNFRRMLGNIYTKGGEAGSKLEDFMLSRATGEEGTPFEGQSLRKRVYQAFVDSVGKGDDRNFYQALWDNDTAAKKTVGPLYDQAYGTNQDISSPGLRDIASTDFGRRALKGAASLMRDDMSNPAANPMLTPEAHAAIRNAYGDDLAAKLGLDQPHGVGEIGPQGLKLQTWDYVKRAMDDQIGAELRGGDKNAARIHIGQKNALLRELDAADQTGAYAQARQIWSDKSAANAAAEWGRSFLSEDPEIITKDMNALSPTEQSYARLGMLRGMRDKLWNAPDTSNFANLAFGREGMRERIQAAFPDQADQQTLSQLMGRYRSEATLLNKTLRGSPTAQRLNDTSKGFFGEHGETANAIADSAMTGSPMPVLRHVAMTGGKRVMADAATRRLSALSDYVRDVDPQSVMAKLSDLNSRSAASPMRNVTPTRTRIEPTLGVPALPRPQPSITASFVNPPQQATGGRVGFDDGGAIKSRGFEPSEPLMLPAPPKTTEERTDALERLLNGGRYVGKKLGFGGAVGLGA